MESYSASRTNLRPRYDCHTWSAIRRLSALWSGLLATFIEVVDSRVIQSLLLGVSVWLLAWAGFGTPSLASHSSRHDALTAKIESMREKLAAEQRERTRRATRQIASESERDPI
jgi:hypothetical protein